MKKKGQMCWAEIDIINPLNGKYLSTHKAFFYTKLAKDMYLIILDSIFNSDPYKRKFSIITEKKFRKLCEGHKLQKSI